MAVNKLTDLIGLDFKEYQRLVQEKKIKYSEARLIPSLKTGGELALTSIFLSSLRLVKEFRQKVFSDIKLPNNGKAYFFTEWHYDGIEKSKKADSRIDGVIIIVISGKIKDVAFIESKKDEEELEIEQIERYQRIAREIKVPKLVTISNQFVENPSDFPIKLKSQISVVKKFHFSWTYLQTIAQILIFENKDNIEDEDQVEIMREVLHYLTHPKSGTNGYHQMKKGWTEVVNSIKGLSKPNTEDIQEAILSWHEEEKDMSLLLSRSIGVYVKTTKTKDSLKLLEENKLLTSKLEVKNAVSDIYIIADFIRESVSMDVSFTPDDTKGSIAKITDIKKDIQKCIKFDSDLMDLLMKDVWIELKIKNSRHKIRKNIAQIEEFEEEGIKKKEITKVRILLIKDFKANFSKPKKFVALIEQMLLDYYKGIVQHLSNWYPDAPKVKGKKKETTQQ